MTRNTKRPIRVLQVVGGMNRGGAETWLMHILRNTDRTEIQMDFLVHSDSPGSYDDEIRSLGSRVLVCPKVGQPWKYALEFLRIVRECGPYDVVHSHVQHFGGLVFSLAAVAGIPVRVAHSHLDTSIRRGDKSRARRLYERLMETFIGKLATHGFGVSEASAKALFGSSWKNDQRFDVLHCGIDLSQFFNGAMVRDNLDLPQNAFVVGHVGRFMPQKNHEFILDIARSVLRRDQSFHFLLIGEGPRKDWIMEEISGDGTLSSHITVLGSRGDIPAVLKSVIDVMILPSRYEGIPLIVMESQAAGTPIILSSVVPEEVDVVKELIVRLSTDDAEHWAGYLLSLKERQIQVTPEAALERMKASSFNIEQSATALRNLYVG